MDTTKAGAASGEATTELAVRFCGRALRDPETGVELARLHDDGEWRTADGAVCERLALPVAKLNASVSPAAQAAANREQDAAWLEAGVEAVRRLAGKAQEFSTDEVWAALTMPPREPRQLGALMGACKRARLVEPTDRHVPSERPINNRRPVRVWRSLVYAAESEAKREGGRDGE